MAEVFTKYPELTDTTTESGSKVGLTHAEYEELTENIKKIAKFKKKQYKRLKKIHKEIRRFCIVKKSPISEKISVDGKASTHKETIPNKNEKREKTFLDKLGDAFLKALPSILIVVITAIFGQSDSKRFRSRKLCIT